MPNVRLEYLTSFNSVKNIPFQIVCPFYFQDKNNPECRCKANKGIFKISKNGARVNNTIPSVTSCHAFVFVLNIVRGKAYFRLCEKHSRDLRHIEWIT